MRNYTQYCPVSDKTEIVASPIAILMHMAVLLVISAAIAYGGVSAQLMFLFSMSFEMHLF